MCEPSPDRVPKAGKWLAAQLAEKRNRPPSQLTLYAPDKSIRVDTPSVLATAKRNQFLELRDLPSLQKAHRVVS